MQKKWGFWILTMFVVGNMVGGGIFMLPANLSKVASPAGATLAWLLTGFGVLMIALVFGNLAIRKPELKPVRKATQKPSFNRRRKAESPAMLSLGDIGRQTGRQRHLSSFHLPAICRLSFPLWSAGKSYGQ